MAHRKPRFAPIAAMLLVGACNSQTSKTDPETSNALCPDLTQVGKGTKAYEEASRCVRVMAARYSTSGQSPNDVATAAIEFCRDSKISLIAPEVTDLVRRDVLTKTLEGQFRDKAIRTVVEMRTGDCVHKAGLFDGVINPIDKP